MRILLVEDDGMIGDGLQKALKKNGLVVNWVGDSEAAYMALDAEPYDLLILDIGLPGESGLDILSKVRKGGNAVPILMLTARDSISDKVAGLDMGADDYLLKPFALEELEARIRSLMRRKVGQSGNENGLFRHGKIALDPKTYEVFIDGKKVALSAREFSLVHTFIKAPKAVLSKAQLEESLYGWNEEVSSNTVEVHIHQIRKKLGSGFIKNIRNIGYTLGDDT